MSLPLIIAINGILTRQATVSWPDQFDAWCDREGVVARVLKKEYLAWPLPLLNIWIKNRILAAGIAAEVELLVNREEMRGEPGREIHFVAHSNGTDVALKAIRSLAARGIATRTLIVVGSVLEPDIEKNGVCELLDEGDLGAAVCYASTCDLALRFGRHSLGYSELGRVGWRYRGQDVDQIPAFAPAGSREQGAGSGGVCFTRWYQDYGHGSYFIEAHRAATFEQMRKDMGL